MITLTYDFVGQYGIKAGSNWNQRITWKDPNGTPINLTGYTAKMQARTAPEATTAIFDFNTENGTIVLGGANGTIDFAVLGSATRNLTPGKYVYDLEMYVGSNVYCILEGEIEIRPNVTRE